MTFDSWTNLIFLPVVAFVAWLVLRRPGVRTHTVGSLKLWQEVLAARGGGESVLRRATLSWALLLAGAVLAVFAAVAPEIEFSSPAEVIAVRVENERWIAPEALAEAKQILAAKFAPAKIAVTEKAYIHSLSGYVIRLRPATRDAAPTGWIALPAKVDDFTLEQFGTDPGGEILTVFRNRTQKPQRLKVAFVHENIGRFLMVCDMGDFTPGQIRRCNIPYRAPNSAFRIVWSMSESSHTVARMLCRPAAPTRVVVVGESSPWVRKAIAAAGAELIAATAEADVVIAIGPAAPTGKPTLNFSAAHNELGWRRAKTPLDAIVLKDATWPQGDALTAGLDFSSVAVRKVRGWTRTDASRGVELLSVDGRALIVQSEPDAMPRQIAVAMSPDTKESNWPLTPSFALFMDRALTWLANNSTAANREIKYVPAPGNPPLGLRADAGDWRGELDRDASSVTVKLVGTIIDLGWLLAVYALACWLAGWALATRRFER